jgi:hypothetical protein
MISIFDSELKEQRIGEDEERRYRRADEFGHNRSSFRNDRWNNVDSRPIASSVLMSRDHMISLKSGCGSIGGGQSGLQAH